MIVSGLSCDCVFYCTVPVLSFKNFDRRSEVCENRLDDSGRHDVLENRNSYEIDDIGALLLNLAAKGMVAVF